MPQTNEQAFESQVEKILLTNCLPLNRGLIRTQKPNILPPCNSRG